MNFHNSALTVRNTATTPITLKRLANLNLSRALFFSTQARQTASSIWGSLPACNMNFVLTQTSLLYSQIERDVCFLIHLYWLSKNGRRDFKHGKDEGVILRTNGRTSDESAPQSPGPFKSRHKSTQNSIACGKYLSLWRPGSPRTMEQIFRPSFESSKTNAR